jgi:hypothetical protein
MRIIAFVDEELAIGNVSVLASVFEPTQQQYEQSFISVKANRSAPKPNAAIRAVHVTKLRQELVAPVLRLLLFIAVPTVFIADDVAVGPPFAWIWDDVFATVVVLFLSVVLVHRAIRAIELDIVAPVVLVVLVRKRNEEHDAATTNHHEDPAAHVKKEVLERIYRRLAISLHASSPQGD